jgi:Iron-containing redox enzyme
MQGIVTLLDMEQLLPKFQEAHRKQNPYANAEQAFTELLSAKDLDRNPQRHSLKMEIFEQDLSSALVKAYGTQESCEAAHQFIQRVLYRLNRLNLFWYDDLDNYANERSPFLHKIRDLIESVWQEWELENFDVESYQQVDVKQSLLDRFAADLEPPLSLDAYYMREQMTLEGYRYLLAIASFDGLIEASRLSRILGGVANEVQATLTKVLLEEYGNGRLSRKHSTFFAQMLRELGLSTRPEAYFDLVPWEVLASINHNFLLTECKRHFLRYNGGLAYFEVAGPAAYRTYLAAAKRLELSEAAMGYWDLHVKEDERHGRWMIHNVTLPLIEMYPDRAWQIVLGYDQEKLMGDRASEAVVRMIRQGEQTEPLPLVLG